MSGQRKRENPYINVIVNVAIPAIVLTRLSDPERLGPLVALLLALTPPIAYGIYDMVTRKKVNIFSLIGIIATLSTGIIGIMKLDYRLVAVKEAFVPLIFSIVIVATQRTRYPILRKMIDEFLDVERIDRAFEEARAKNLFERRLNQTAYVIGCSFLLSALLNFMLARLIVVSPSGTPAFNEQLGTLQWLSYPIIAVPTTIIMLVAVYRLISSIKAHTGLTVEDVLRK